MTSFLFKLFIKDHTETASPAVRVAYGVLAGTTGIAANILLFIFKFAMGLLSGSVAVTADAFNNLSDAGSSVVSLIGLKLAAKPADPDHPFGHGRFEYLASLVIAAIIFVVGGSFFKSSVEKIFAPEPVNASPIVMIILALSICVKLWLFFFNRTIGIRIDSSAIRAAGQDSLNDVFVTLAALVGILVSRFFGISVDGWIGLGVAIFILRSAWEIAKDTVDTLLGAPADPELCNELCEKVLDCDCVHSIHDLIVHNYGPGRIMASVHAEVPANCDILKAHDAIDLIERRVLTEMGIPLVIHLDPIDLDSPETVEMRIALTRFVHEISPHLDIHDFRMVIGDTHTNLIFDMKVPLDCQLSDAQIKETLDQIIAREKQGQYYTVITFDRAFI